MSLPKLVVSWPMRFNSNAPSASRARASETMVSTGFERILPRMEGMVQNAQRWLQPSLMRRYAQCRGVRRKRFESSSK